MVAPRLEPRRKKLSWLWSRKIAKAVILPICFLLQSSEYTLWQLETSQEKGSGRGWSMQSRVKGYFSESASSLRLAQLALASGWAAGGRAGGVGKLGW